MKVNIHGSYGFWVGKESLIMTLCRVRTVSLDLRLVEFVVSDCPVHSTVQMSHRSQEADYFKMPTKEITCMVSVCRVWADIHSGKPT